MRRSFLNQSGHVLCPSPTTIVGVLLKILISSRGLCSFILFLLCVSPASARTTRETRNRITEVFFVWIILMKTVGFIRCSSVNARPDASVIACIRCTESRHSHSPLDGRYAVYTKVYMLCFPAILRVAWGGGVELSICFVFVCCMFFVQGNRGDVHRIYYKVKEK